MNIVLWILQSVLALLNLVGGSYKVFNPENVAKQIPALPTAGWRAVGILELLGALLLVVPMLINWMPTLTPLAAGVLGFEALGLAALYASYSRKLSPANPLVYAIPMALLAILVAYGRSSVSPVI